jgi:acetyl esterase/lipase
MRANVFVPALLCASAVLLFAATRAAGGGPEKPVKTFVYKTAGKVDIHADVYRKDDGALQPAVVWLHGGALITGSRTPVPKDLLDYCLSHNYTVVSFDYRLAPEVKLPAIIADVEDAFRWLHGKGRELCQIDPRRGVVVAGGSAGGYLTLVTGYRVKPRPTALVSYWGYGDVDGEWYTKPSEHYRKRPLVSKEEAEKAVGAGILTGVQGPEGKARGRYYLYLRQNGLWTREVTGFDPVKDKAKLAPYCPVRNVSADYPPTLLLHGTEDTDVPYALSEAMARELTRFKVVHELVTVKGGEHGLAGADAKLIAASRARALAFIGKHLDKAKE